MKARTKPILVEAELLDCETHVSATKFAGSVVLEGKAGQWLVVYENGRKEILDEAEFVARFEVVLDEAS